MYECMHACMYGGLNSLNLSFRVFKQTLRSAGSGLTPRHVEDISLGVLFLYEAAKKTDKAFKAAPQTTTHSVRTAEDDISSMARHLLAQGITSASANRNTPAFIDPTQLGWQKLCTTSWLQERLSASVQEEEGEIQVDHGEVDLDYELSTVT